MSDYRYMLCLGDGDRRYYRVIRRETGEVLGEVEAESIKHDGWTHHETFWRARRLDGAWTTPTYSTREQAVQRCLDDEWMERIRKHIPADPFEGLA